MKDGRKSLQCSIHIIAVKALAATLNRMADGIEVGILYVGLMHHATEDATEDATEKPVTHMAAI